MQNEMAMPVEELPPEILTDLLKQLADLESALVSLDVSDEEVQRKIGFLIQVSRREVVALESRQLYEIYLDELDVDEYDDKWSDDRDEGRSFTTLGIRPRVPRSPNNSNLDTAIADDDQIIP